jgi:NADPH:quinone reductase-like Zn-dependent oxidoreductase
VKAVRIHEDGGPEVLRYEDVPDPTPGAGEVLVELRASGLNHLDLWIRKGLPSAPKPRILGADGAGIVAALGTGVDRFSVGDRVVVNPGIDHGGGKITVIGEHTDGTCCELKAFPASQLYPLDDTLSFEEGAAFPLTFETAYRMLVTKAAVREGEWALIWGIGGGVALAAFEICRALGVRTIVTSSSREKLARARDLGADVVLDHGADDVVGAVKEATGGGANVVVETVGEATWERSLAAAGQEGRILVCGATTGHSPPARLYRIWWKQLVVMGSTMGTAADFEGAYELIRSGGARVHLDSTFPLEEAVKAHERLESGAQFGKVVLRIPR